jgi:phosphate ABC transporter phosphate-binding protein
MPSAKVAGYLGSYLTYVGAASYRVAVAACASALLAACCLTASAAPAAASAAACPYVPITGAGSTWSANAFDAWDTDVAAFDCIQVSYAAVGSASGAQEFSNGIVDFAASEIPYGVALGNSENPPPTRGYTYMPDVAGGVAFMYNLQIGGHYVTNLRLSGAVIAGIFTNQITMWNDPAIAADNPGLTLPAEPIIPVVRVDVSGATWAFTQWMSATESSDWTAYCAATGLSSCGPTTTYPVQPGTAMISQSGDLGVSGYVSQPTADGAIGFTEYSYALETGFPVANVLNAAGYYTQPTPDNVGVSLLSATVNTDGTENLSQVYTDTDPRTYELSYYSYMILPTDTSFGLTDAAGYTLASFGQYALCQGQQQMDGLGYAALPINLVEDAYAQLLEIPDSPVPSTATAFIQGCDNPTFASDGTDTLLADAPMPPACDQQGPTQCLATGTTLTAAPNPAVVGEVVTLTATTAASDGTMPAGSVQFEVGAADIGPPVAVNASGVATTTTTAGSAGLIGFIAVFTPTDPSYPPSTGTFSLTVGPGTDTVPVTAIVPPTGTFTVTIPAGVTLTQSGASATGNLTPIIVSDSRNTYPGWSVSGLAGNFTGTGLAIPYTIPADDLGWVPGTATLPAGITLGPAIVAGTSPGGLGDAGGVLADAADGYGYGTYTFDAALTLDIPAAAPAGSYTGTLTITYLEAGP